MVRLSISRKDKQTGEYSEDFSGFVAFVGTAAAKKAACLKEGARIKLGDVDVTSKYVKAENKTYYNFKCFSFDIESNAESNAPATEATNDPQPVVDSGEVDDRLPF